MSTPAGQEPGQEERQIKAAAKNDTPPNQNLTVQYGKIGIPAVAAALRYCDAGRNPAYAPVVPRNDHRLFEMAA
jgi:hypothetical protein